jgi:hypothetical protein
VISGAGYAEVASVGRLREELDEGVTIDLDLNLLQASQRELTWSFRGGLEPTRQALQPEDRTKVLANRTLLFQEFDAFPAE